VVVELLDGVVRELVELSLVSQLKFNGWRDTPASVASNSTIYSLYHTFTLNSTFHTASQLQITPETSIPWRWRWRWYLDFPSN